MSNERIRLLVLAVVVGVVACASVQVTSDYDPSADFSKYSTFSFLPPKEIKSDLVRDRIEGAITTQLTGKGLTLASGNADLVVAYHARLDKETQVDTTSYGYGWGGGWGGYYRPAYGPYGGMGGTTTTVREIPVGALFVDLVDAKEKKMVWQGVASGTLDPKATADDKDYRVNNAVKKMFSGFPPK